jgi:hypothetical protein
MSQPAGFRAGVAQRLGVAVPNQHRSADQHDCIEPGDASTLAPAVHWCALVSPTHSLLVLGATLVLLLTPAQAQATGDFCAPLPCEASIVHASQSETVETDGVTRWSSTVTYTLSTGETAEAALSFANNQTGEVHFAIDGEVIVHSSYSESAEPGANLDRGLVTRSWTAPDLSERQELVAELLQESVGEILIAGLVPQAIKCTSLAKGVMRGLKYLWVGATAAAGAACCAGTGILGCAVCAAGAAAAGTAGAEAANNHCD